MSTENTTQPERARDHHNVKTGAIDHLAELAHPSFVSEAMNATPLTPYYFNAAYNTFTCFSQSDDVKDIAACIASPPELVEDFSSEEAITQSRSCTDLYYKRFEEYYRIFKKNRKKKVK